MIGPLITGAAMEWFGNNALFQMIGLSHLFLAIHMTYRIMRREAPDSEDSMDYQVGPVATVGLSTETFSLDPRSDAETYMAEEKE